MGCRQHPVKDGRVDGFAGKFSTDISAAEDDVVQGDLGYSAGGAGSVPGGFCACGAVVLLALLALLALARQVVDQSPFTLPMVRVVDAQ
jgi:hypothetical protein